MSVKDRLIKFAKSKERSVRAFEIATGLTIGYINAIRVSIQPDKIQRIASHYPDLNTEWLLTGEGEMLKPLKNEYSQISQQEMKEIWAEEFDKYLVKMYKEGDIFPVAVVDKMLAEKDKETQRLQEKIQQLQEEIARLKAQMINDQ